MRQSFEFPADTSVLAEIGELIADAAFKAGFNDGEIGDIQLAVDEACTNCIRHGLHEDPASTFRISIRWAPDEMEILVCEHGAPFDPDDVKMPDLKATLEKRPVGKLGIYFIRKMMDEVEYHTGRDGEKTLRMLKRKFRI